MSQVEMRLPTLKACSLTVCIHKVSSESCEAAEAAEALQPGTDIRTDPVFGGALLLRSAGHDSVVSSACLCQNLAG